MCLRWLTGVVVPLLHRRTYARFTFISFDWSRRRWEGALCVLPLLTMNFPCSVSPSLPSFPETCSSNNYHTFLERQTNRMMQHISSSYCFLADRYTNSKSSRRTMSFTQPLPVHFESVESVVEFLRDSSAGVVSTTTPMLIGTRSMTRGRKSTPEVKKEKEQPNLMLNLNAAAVNAKENVQVLSSGRVR